MKVRYEFFLTLPSDDSLLCTVCDFKEESEDGDYVCALNKRNTFETLEDLEASCELKVGWKE